MQVVVPTNEGTLEVAWTWLPSFIGMNSALKLELELAVSDKLLGKVLNQETLLEAHELVITFLCEKFSGIKGLDCYLDSLKYVYVE